MIQRIWISDCSEFSMMISSTVIKVSACTHTVIWRLLHLFYLVKFLTKILTGEVLPSVLVEYRWCQQALAFAIVRKMMETRQSISTRYGLYLEKKISHHDTTSEISQPCHTTHLSQSLHDLTMTHFRFIQMLLFIVEFLTKKLRGLIWHTPERVMSFSMSQNEVLI